MALDERSRHELSLRLEETLGADAATTLMEHLPPVGWADVATKRDLDQTAALLRSDLDQSAALLRSDLDQSAERLRAEFYKAMAEQTRTIVLTMLAANIGAVVTVAGLAFAAARLM
jgi:class 3 adenylate cyclase